MSSTPIQERGSCSSRLSITFSTAPADTPCRAGQFAPGTRTALFSTSASRNTPPHRTPRTPPAAPPRTAGPAFASPPPVPVARIPTRARADRASPLPAHRTVPSYPAAMPARLPSSGTSRNAPRGDNAATSQTQPPSVTWAVHPLQSSPPAESNPSKSNAPLSFPVVLLHETNPVTSLHFVHPLGAVSLPPNMI